MKRSFIAAALVAFVIGLSAPSAASAANLVTNPSVERYAVSTGRPVGWLWERVGANNAVRAITRDARTGRVSVKTSITRYSSGAAGWYFKPVGVTPGARYRYVSHFKASAPGTVYLRYTHADGRVRQVFAHITESAGTWQRDTVEFTVPATAVKATVIHQLNGTGSLLVDDVSLDRIASPVPPRDTTPPLGAVMTPRDEAVVSGVTTVSVAARDNVGVSHVGFAIDGQEQGSDLVAPYAWQVDTTGFEDGTHTLSVHVTDFAGNTTTDSVEITIDNTPPPINLVPNPSVEATDALGRPQGWSTDRWGSNNATFSVVPVGAGEKALRVSASQVASGDAKWFFAPQPVVAGQYYRYTDYYLADVITNVVAVLRDTTGTVTYVRLKDAPVSKKWTRYKDGFMVPAGTVSATVYHLLAKPGTLTTDDFALTPVSTPEPFDRAIVSLTFDDGWATDATTAFPLMAQHGFAGTHFVVSGFVGNTAAGYLTAAQVASLAAGGEEIASHTATHPYLTRIPASQVTSELVAAKTSLASVVGTSPAHFAFPYGEHDAQVVKEVRRHHASARTTINGYNTPQNFDPYRIVVKGVDSFTSTTTVASWVDHAIANKYWLVLMYHRIDNTGGSSVTAANLDATLAYIKASGVAVMPVGAALDELLPQATN